MSRRVFFSFHYADVWRAMQVRNSWVVRGSNEIAGFVDKADFESAERQGARAVEQWIDQQLNGTSATVVLVGTETASRPYVQYEIRKSYERGNRLLGIWINNVKDSQNNISSIRGPNPFQSTLISTAGSPTNIAQLLQIPLYDWVNDDGRNRISDWIEAAPRAIA